MDLWDLGCVVLEMIAGPAVYDAHKTPMSAVHEICGEVASWSRRRGSSIPVDGVWACLRNLLESLLAPYVRRAYDCSDGQ